MSEIKIVINAEEKDLKINVFQDATLVEEYNEKMETKRLEGNIYLGKVTDIYKAMQSAFVDIGEDKNGLIHLKDIMPKQSPITGNEKVDLDKFKISDYIKQNENVIVQVKRDSAGTKGAKLTKDIKIIGEYVVLMPFSKFYTVSKKIDNVNEKNRIKEIVINTLNKDVKTKNMGFIIRTSAENQEKSIIENEVNELITKFNLILEKASKNEGPCILYDNGGIVGKIITDFLPYNPIVETNDSKIKEEIQKDYKNIKVNFTNNNIKQELKNKVWLKCGGYIIIDHTEALIAIDVNSGKCTDKKNNNATVLKVNEEAAIEIAKQIRLRDLGGIIVIDFIDMDTDEDREKIKQIFIKEAQKDRSKVQVVEFTKLGLLELTRKQIFKK